MFFYWFMSYYYSLHNLNQSGFLCDNSSFKLMTHSIKFDRYMLHAHFIISIFKTYYLKYRFGRIKLIWKGLWNQISPDIMFFISKRRKKANKKKRSNILKKRNSLKNGEASGVSLSNFQGGFGVPLFNIEGGPGSHF